MTDWKEVYCWPCGEQGDNTRDLLAVTGIHPLKIAFNKLYGLFICMHCNTPLDCSPGFKELNTEYIYTHFTSKVHKSFFMKSGVAREFLKNTCSKFYTDNAHADAKDRLTALIKHIQKSDLFLDHPIAGLALMRDGGRCCKFSGCSYSSLSDETMKKHWRVHTKGFVAGMESISTKCVIQKWTKGQCIPVLATALPETSSVAQELHADNEYPSLRNILDLLDAGPDKEQHNKDLNKNDIQAKEYFTKWDEEVLSVNDESNEIAKKTELARRSHFAHDSKDSDAIQVFTQAAYNIKKHHAFHKMNPNYMQKLYLVKKDELREHERESSDKRNINLAAELIHFIFLLCGFHRGEQLEEEDMEALPGSNDQHRLKNIGHWAIIPNNQQTPSHTRIYSCTKAAWDVVRAMADSNGTREINESDIEVFLELEKALYCREKVASEVELQEVLVRFIVAKFTDEEDCTRASSNVITSAIASLQFNMRITFLKSDFGDPTTEQYDVSFNKQRVKFLSPEENNVAAILHRQMKYISDHSNFKLGAKVSFVDPSCRTAEVLGSSAKATPVTMSVDIMSDGIRRAIKDVTEGLDTLLYGYKGLDGVDITKLVETPTKFNAPDLSRSA